MPCNPVRLHCRGIWTTPLLGQVVQPAENEKMESNFQQGYFMLSHFSNRDTITVVHIYGISQLSKALCLLTCEKRAHDTSNEQCALEKVRTAVRS